MKIVFDTSAIISVSQSCLIKIFGGLKEKIGAEFLVPEAVYHEAVLRPISIKRFELNAVRIKKAIDDKWFEIAKVEGDGLYNEIDELANNCFFIKHKPVRLLQKGEVEALCLIKKIGAEAFAIDERTTRMLVESPREMEKILEARRKRNVDVKMENVSALQEMFKDLTIVRSVELISLAFEYGLLDEELPKGKQSLEAALFAAKYSGCAVSAREINMFLHKRE